MRKLQTVVHSVSQQVAVEFRTFWRSRQTIYLTFLVPMLGMALFVYLNGEGMLESAFAALFRGRAVLNDVSAMTLMTLGLIVYCIVDVAFESMVPRLVRERSAGIYKRLGGTPLPVWALLLAKSLTAGIIVLLEIALILAMGLLSADITMAGSPWLLGAIALLGTFTTTALGFALSSVTASAEGAVVAVHAIYIPMLFLCGAFVPLQALPRLLQVVARAVPLTYFVAPFHSVMVGGASVRGIWIDLLILLAWLLGAWFVAVKTFRWQ